jgi:hypothetical protein
MLTSTAHASKQQFTSCQLNLLLLLSNLHCNPGAGATPLVMQCLVIGSPLTEQLVEIVIMLLELNPSNFNCLCGWSVALLRCSCIGFPLLAQGA